MIGILEEMKRQGRKIMAERRMIAKTVLHSPSFLAMPVAAQMLYVHLELFADDDGFVATPLQVVRMMGIQKRFYQVLIDQGFVIPFDSGVCVLCHWHQQNQIQPSRHKATIYEEEMSCLSLANNKAYVLCRQSADKMSAQYRVDKTRVDKTRVDKTRVDKTRPEKKREEQTRAEKLPLSQRRFVF